MSTPTGSVSAYLRISIDRTGEAASVERQSKRARTIARQHKLPAPVEYIEPGGTSASKPRGRNSAYARLLADVRAGKISVVIVWDIDRFLRRPDELEEWLSLCEGRGIRIITMDGEIDTDTPNGRLFLRIKVSVARHEVEHKAARQRDANRDRAERGQPWNAGRRTFGYLPDFSGHVSGEAEQIRQAFVDVSHGASLRSIARRWNAAGSLSSQGNPWTTAALRLLLRNPTYTGRRVYRSWKNGRKSSEPVVDVEMRDVRAIIDPDTFAAVHVILDDPSRLTSDRGGRGPLHLLSGVASCGVCHAPRLSYGRSSPRLPGGQTYGVLRCRECFQLARKADPIESYVAEVVLAQLRRPDMASLFEPARQDLRPLRARVRDLSAQRTALARDLSVDWSFAAARDRRLREEMEKIDAEIASLSVGSALAPFAGLRDPHEVWGGLDIDAKRAVIRELVEVVVLPVGRQGRKPFDPDTVVVTPKQPARPDPPASSGRRSRGAARSPADE